MRLNCAQFIAANVTPEAGAPMHHPRIVLALVLSLSGATQAWPQARQSVVVPAQQRALTDVLSKYNEMYASAPNSIQRDKVRAAATKEFCAKIPVGNVTGWIGGVSSIDNNTPSKGINLILDVHTINLFSGGLGVMLSLGNRYAYGVSADGMQPHTPTIIPVGSKLYGVVSNLREGDTVMFSGTFIPYVSEQACYGNGTSYFALVNFSNIQKLGYDIDMR